MGEHKCPKCQNELETIKEVNTGTFDKGSFTFWECPVCGWNNREERLYG